MNFSMSIDAGVWTLRAFLGAAPALLAAPRGQVEPIRVITQQPGNYHAWATMARLRNGHILAAYSGGRENHVCPFGRVELMRSTDDGATWSWPQTIMDTPIDDRDAGIVETAKGSILVDSRVIERTVTDALVRVEAERGGSGKTTRAALCGVAPGALDAEPVKKS